MVINAIPFFIERKIFSVILGKDGIILQESIRFRARKRAVLSKTELL